MSQAPLDPEPAPLKAFQDLVKAGPPAPGAFENLLPALEQASLVEHALALLRQMGADAAWEPVRARLKAEVSKGRARRMNLWQTDPHRKTLRILFGASGLACRLNPPGLIAQLARALLDAGLPLAMGLEKNPRPALCLGHPLPLEVPGRGEWADAVLLHAADSPLAELPGRISAVAPEGLEVLRCLPVPNYATPVSDLCRAAVWHWECPVELRGKARERIAGFLGADRFDMEKAGKTGGQKGAKRVEIRSLVEAMDWEGDRLEFRTRIASGQAPNPRKLLGAILGEDPAAITALERVRLVLGEDPRINQADRFEPKLHNMYEDAVLLDSGSHITLVEGDDDDPILIGG